MYPPTRVSEFFSRFYPCTDSISDLAAYRDLAERELKAASVKVVALQDEIKLLSGRCAALDEQNFGLKVDANQWR